MIPEISVIMQSKFLRENPKEKLYRAINSVLGQKQKCSYELIIVADNCYPTFEAVQTEFQSYIDDGKIRLFLLDDGIKRNWRTEARNVGLAHASGTWVVYLDNDDYYANNYLKVLCSRLDITVDWYLVNDLFYNKTTGQFKMRHVNMKQGCCGTANIVHKRKMGSRWPEGVGYGREDWRFIMNLNHESRKMKTLDVAGYCVAHWPGDNGYEI